MKTLNQMSPSNVWPQNCGIPSKTTVSPDYKLMQTSWPRKAYFSFFFGSWMGKSTWHSDSGHLDSQTKIFHCPTSSWWFCIAFFMDISFRKRFQCSVIHQFALVMTNHRILLLKNFWFPFTFSETEAHSEWRYCEYFGSSVASAAPKKRVWSMEASLRWNSHQGWRCPDCGALLQYTPFRQVCSM